MDGRIIEKSMRDALQKRFGPVCLEITNTSPDHQGHLNSSEAHMEETHFSIRIKSEIFNRMVSLHHRN
ncbi:hypothetical protein HK407_12g17040 [Ordospora pajunii]|uniref:uncharacterized protein n=1 Tax=Ordospora pajunii TaxID=3039483 RepID=UPI0029527792|nr:uncharacterized protein HK407_12g17040 [Ordospora pajunii]KAH9410573.1 hypothetical protein HK407_12g17040 [Ordospora pajunii]